MQELKTRTGLAGVSGLIVGLIQDGWGIFQWLENEIWLYVLSGIAFAAGVLLPHFRRDAGLWLRGLAGVAISVLSYYCAVWTALDGPLAGNDWASFTMASLVGAAIVVVPLVWLAPLAASRRLFALAGIAALVGGPITAATLPEELGLIVIGHVSWHLLIALALHIGARSEGPATPKVIVL